MERSLVAKRARAALSFGLVGSLLTFGCAHATPVSFDGTGGESTGSSPQQHAASSVSAVVSTSDSSTDATTSTSVTTSSTVSTGSGCAFPMELCNGICIDTSGDPNNCGGCNHICNGGEQCGHGQCQVAGACDGNGDCTTCLNCSITPPGACSAQADACFNDPECNAFLNCIQPCMDQACADACATAHPTGVNLYMAVTDCAFCQGCPIDCAGQDPNCP